MTSNTNSNGGLASLGPPYALVIVRLDRTIQYSGSASDGVERPRRTGYPLEPVIGLADGETRWRV